MTDESPVAPIHHVALIGNFPPRRCGIATFTADLHAALGAASSTLQLSTIAMNDPASSHAYPELVSYEIDQENIEDYRSAANHINAINPDVVCLQHEYGIFGGQAGDHVLALVDRLRAPLVTTLHTVLTTPTPDQRRVTEALAAASSRLVVMTGKARDILMSAYHVADEKIAVIPHGIPDLPFLDPALAKHRFALEGRRVVLTFGLLSPGKGIEMMISAMPQLVRDHPEVVYVVLGATHPHLLRREGERYRQELQDLALRLGVAEHVRFVNEYVDTPTLQAWLTACDIYVTPYLSEAQITSGTLSYAVGLGKAVVSTPYWHARDLLSDGCGELVPFASPDALARTIGDLLGDDHRRDALRRKAYEASRQMIWPVVAASYLRVFAEARASHARARGSAPFRASEILKQEPALSAITRMTDDCGLLQHARGVIADRNHGYCLDDNARALMLTVDFAAERIEADKARNLARIYASFVDHAWDSSSGRFRNFMSYKREWLEAEGSQDSFGRALWAIGRTAGRTDMHELKLWATSLGEKVIPAAGYLESPRAQAFAILGLAAWLVAYPGHRPARRLLEAFARHLQALLRRNRRDGWTWFEPVLAYDNARLPEAMLVAGEVLAQADMQREGLEALAWLMERQTAQDGHFRPVGTLSFGLAYHLPHAFDQQPLEGWATIDACAKAHELTGEAMWISHADRAFSWYHGANDLGLRLATANGGCQDGLQIDRVNLNQGAESLLSYQFANLAIRRLRKAATNEVANENFPDDEPTFGCRASAGAAR